MNCWRKISKILIVSLLATLIAIYPFYEKSALAAFGKFGLPGNKAASKLAGKLSEASPPEVIQELREALDDYQPQVKILSPKSDQVLNDTTVSVRFQVNDLPIFKDERLGLGPHLHLFLDNQPYQAVYSTKQPFVLENLTPGTHSLRVFASRPWHESFKNEGAYAQTTFHVFTKTQDNRPNSDLPLLTYSRPQGSNGAEPIMLDFYLTNAPLHLVAQEDNQDDISDWRIRVTVNGDSFVLDRWQPIYLKGFKPGKNWVQVEYLDEKGNPIQNVFNNTARLITLEPGGQDTLSRLVRGELTAAEARGIVDPNYVPPVIKQPEPQPSPEPTPKVTPKVAPSPSEVPKADRTKQRESAPMPIPVAPTESKPKVTDTKKPDAGVENQPTPGVSPKSVESAPEQPRQPEKSRTSRWLDKLRQSRRTAQPDAAQPQKPEIKLPPSSPEPMVEPVTPAKQTILVQPKPEPVVPSPVAKPRLEQERSRVLIEEKPVEPKPSPQPSAPGEKAKQPEKSSSPRWLDQLKQSLDRSRGAKPAAKTIPQPSPIPLPTPVVDPAPVIRSQEPERSLYPASKPTVKPNQPIPQIPRVQVKEPIQVSPKPETAASSRRQPAKDYYEQLRRPTPSPTGKPLQPEPLKSAESKPGVGSTVPSEIPNGGQTPIPSELSAPGRNLPLVEKTASN